MRNVRPKLSHVAALEWVISFVDNIDPENSAKERAALYDLLDRMRQAAQPLPSEPAGLSPGRFVELAREHLPTYAPPVGLVTDSAKKAWYGRIGRQLQDTGLTEATATAMLRHVARWAKMPLTTETLLAKAPAWSAQAAKAGELNANDTSRPPAGLFDDEAGSGG